MARWEVVDDKRSDVRKGADEMTFVPCIRVANPVEDMDMALDAMIPESLDWRHVDEGAE